MIINAQEKLKIEEDFKVQAGPGAGKTEFLVNHIKNVIQTSENLERTRKIACITYTNIAVETVLKRLGKSVSNRVDVSTIHSFLYRNVVKPYCYFLPQEYEVCIQKLKGHNDPVVNRKYVSEWLEDGDFEKLKHPNSKNQLLKLTTQNKALQNWLLSMRLSYENNDIQFVCDNTKAQEIDKDSKNIIRIKKENLNILDKKLLTYKKNILEKWNC